MANTIGKLTVRSAPRVAISEKRLTAPKQPDAAATRGSSFEPARKPALELRGFTAAAAPAEAQRCGALGVIRKHFDALDTAAGLGARDGIIGRTDLEAAARNTRLPAELRSACQSLISNPAALAGLDVASGYKQTDGLFSLGDLDAERYRLGTAALASLGVLGSDAYVSRADLAAARRDPSTSPDAKAVCAYFLDDAAAMSRLDDAERFRALATFRKHFGAIDTAAGIGTPDGLVGRVDLEQAVKRSSPLPAEAKKACEFLLRHPDAFAHLDMGYGAGTADNLVSMADLDAEQYRLGLSVLEANFGALDTVAGIGSPDGLVGKVDLEAAAKSATLPRELVQVSQFLLGNQAFLDRLDVGAGFGSTDDLISRTDLGEQQLKLALGVVERNLGALDQAAGLGAADGIVGKGDLVAAANDPSKPAELRWAASWLLSHPAAFDRLETAAGIGGADGLFSSLDLDAVAGRYNPGGVVGLAPANLTEQQKYQYYANIVRAHGGAVNPGGMPTVLGLRGVRIDGAQHGSASTRTYDEVFVVLTPDGRAIELAGATHPGQSSSRASPDVNRDGAGDVGTIRPGTYLARPNGPHANNSSWHVVNLNGAEGIAGWRDTNHDGVYSDGERAASEARGDTLTGVLFHQGNASAPSSIGCQTLSPAEFNRLIAALGGAGSTFTYTLVNAG